MIDPRGKDPMKRAAVALVALAAMTGCATAEPAPAAAAPISIPVAADESLTINAGFEGAMKSAEERQRVFDDPASSVILTGGFVQGGLLRGQTLPGAKAMLDGEPIPVAADGKFLIGFGRD
ncbi:MAG TPA: hypothetical protein DDZ68_15515, partial [Parvularcula sp.]|nr:hypothetical protein [Parvularcula sp.]